MVDRKSSETKTFFQNIIYMFCLYNFSVKCIIKKNYLLPYGPLKLIKEGNSNITGNFFQDDRMLS